MAQSYKQDFKDQVLEDIKQSGLSASEAAKKYKISPHTVYKWLQSAGVDGSSYRQLLKDYKRVQAQNEVLCALVKKFATDSLKKN